MLAWGVHEMLIHTLSEFAAMTATAARAGAVTVRVSGKATARLALPPLDAGDRWLATLDEHAAEFDYRFKAGRLRLKDMMADCGADGGEDGGEDGP